MPVGVAQQVVQHPYDGVLAGPHDHRVRGVRQRHRQPPPRACDCRRGDRGQVHRAGAAHRRAVVVQPGQQQQVVHQAAEPSHVDEHVVRRLRPGRHLGVRLRDLELGPDRRQRAAQLVRRVRDEGALPGATGRQPVQHVVQGLGQPGHLVAGRRHRQPCPGACLGDVADTSTQRGDRLQCRADQEPAGHREASDEQRHPDQQHQPHDVHAAGRLGSRHRDEDRAPVRGRPRPRGHHPQAVRDADPRPRHRAHLPGPYVGQCPAGQQRDQCVTARRRRAHPAAVVDHLHEHRAAGRRHGPRQVPAVDQGGHVLRALPGRVVQGADQRLLQGEGHHHRAGHQHQRDESGRREGEPALHADLPAYRLGRRVLSHRRPPAGSRRHERSRCPAGRTARRSCAGGSRRRPRPRWGRRSSGCPTRAAGSRSW